MKKVRYKRIALFVALTFALSWGFDAFTAWLGGRSGNPAVHAQPWGMLVPASVALFLGMFVYRDSGIHVADYRERPRLILFAFFILTVVYGLLVIAGTILPGLGKIVPGVGALLFTLWTLFTFFIYGQSSKTALEKAGLSLKNIAAGQKFVFGIILFLGVQAVCNMAFGLGEFRGVLDRIYSIPIPSPLYYPVLAVFFVAVTVIGVPLSGLAAFFGEEYGWRGFLQSETVNAGTIRGVICVGVIWGFWHIPVILRGVHTYPPTLLGFSAGFVFFMLWGMIQGYAILKTRCIWIAAFMHGVVNSVYSFILTYIVRPHDMMFSFGLGLYGIACLCIVVMFVLLDPVWKKNVDESV